MDAIDSLAQVRAYQEIQQLPIRYANCMDRKDVEGLLPLFSDHINMGPAGRGREGVGAFYRQTWANFRRSVHRISNHQIDIIDATTAKGFVYCFAEQESHDGGWTTLMISYDDSYVLEDGRWRFKSRRLGIWYREIEGRRQLGAGEQPLARSLPDSLPEWQAFQQARTSDKRE